MMRAKDIRAAVRSLRNGNSRLALDRIALLQSASRKNTRRSAREKPAGFVPCGISLACVRYLHVNHIPYSRRETGVTLPDPGPWVQSRPCGRRGLMLAYQFGPGARQRGARRCLPREAQTAAPDVRGGGAGLRWEWRHPMGTSCTALRQVRPEPAPRMARVWAVVGGVC